MTPPPFRAIALVLLGSTALAACSTFKPPEIDYDDLPFPAALQADPPRPVKVVEIPKLLPLPGQLKSLSRTGKALVEPNDPKIRVEQANAAARIQPSRAGYINAVQVYPFSDGALYQVYAAPGEITDIALQDGEQLVGSGPVAAGDTVRWIIGDTESGAGATKKTHIMVKPTRADLMTNLVINTDRRTYHLELRSTEKTYMASVSWLYPQDELIALRRQNAVAEAAAPVDSGLDLANLNFRYAIDGDAAPWRPTMAAGSMIIKEACLVRTTIHLRLNFEPSLLQPYGSRPKLPRLVAAVRHVDEREAEVVMQT
jgi:type IV secretion system protein VirB9